MNNQLILYGASGHAKVISDIAIDNKISVVGFVDDDVQKKSFLEKEIFHHFTVLKKQFPQAQIVVSIGNNEIRKKIVEKTDSSFGTLIHSEATISKSSKIGEGTVIMPCSVINAETIIGKHTIINTSAVIEHDCVIGDFVHVSPQATVTGGVQIGEGTHIGAGAVVIPGVKIGKWVTVGAGTVIIRDIPDFCTVVGNPGKIIKINQNES